VSGPPTAAAATVNAWYRHHRDDATPQLAAMSDDHPVLMAAQQLARAADSDDDALRRDGIRALFAEVVEPLNDGFDPGARALQARVFARVAWTLATDHEPLRRALAEAGIHDERALHRRHDRVRHRDAPLAGDRPRQVVIPSRVTLGADILITSVLAQRCHRAWPEAAIVIAGDPKLGGLLGGLPGVRIAPLRYPRRGPLADRFASWLGLRTLVDELAADVVLAPDSRIDQLGLLPVIDEERYRLWENTQEEPTRPRSLARLVDRWSARILEQRADPPCRPRVAFDAPTAAVAERWRACLDGAWCAVKLDHGGNPDKALGPEAEGRILTHLREQGWRILIDYGFGDEEMAANDALLQAVGWAPLEVDDSGRGGTPVGRLTAGAIASAEVVRFHGSIAGWAAAVSACHHAVSYDSVGHHLAAALGIPLTSVFTGHRNDAFPVAWCPTGPASVDQVVVPTAERHDPAQWRRVLTALPTPPA